MDELKNTWIEFIMYMKYWHIVSNESEKSQVILNYIPGITMFKA